MSKIELEVLIVNTPSHTMEFDIAMDDDIRQITKETYSPEPYCAVEQLVVSFKSGGARVFNTAYLPEYSYSPKETK